jgi:hypothetical protein
MSNDPPDNKQKYEACREDHKTTFQLSGDYAKWFISTLLLLNSGAIAAIFQKGQTYACAVLIHGLGIMLALAAGFAGWLNLQWASQHFRASTEEILEGVPMTPLPAKIATARCVAVTLSILSALSLGLGAILIWRQLF